MKPTIRSNHWTAVTLGLASRSAAALQAGLLLSLGLLYQASSQTLPLEISANACLITWPETAEEEIGLVADSPDGPWRPLPELISRRGALWSTTVTATNHQQQYYTRVLGTQFNEDFGPPKPPCASKYTWEPSAFVLTDLARWSVDQSGNALEIQTLSTPMDVTGRLLFRLPGPYVAVQDFWASVDILGFESTGDAMVGITARGEGGPDGPYPGERNGYIGSVHPNGMGLNQATLNIWDGTTGHSSSPPLTFKPGTPYRLIFTGVGTSLTVELIDLESLETEVFTIEHSRFSQGEVGLWVQTGTAPSLQTTLDNFFLTGTKPANP